jgi:glycosyltransferase involved in cell wall biosynthesis
MRRRQVDASGEDFVDEQLGAVYGAADLFVMASQHTSNGDFEGFGIAVVEAALCLPATLNG